MTIGELKQKIKDLPDDMKVGGSGYFGEYLECLDAHVTTVYPTRRDYTKMKIFCIINEHPGDEPD